MEETQTYLQKGVSLAMEFAPKLAGGLLVLWLGFWVAKKLSILIKKGLERSNFSLEISSFIVSLAAVGMKGMVLLSAAGIVGFDTSSLVAVIAAASFAVGMALQGGLGNLASGILILVFKPYKVHDWIEVQDKFGKVEEIQIFNTIMVTPGLKTLIIPNGQVTDNIVTNFSRKNYIRMELNVTMPYAESYPRVEKIIMEALMSTPGVLQTPVPEIGIETYDSHNMVIAVRPYVVPDDFWNVTFETHRRIKAAFSENDVKVAYSEGIELGPIGA
ncbi:MAG: small conductance mechanosensitive channel [Paraglaciecola sp.]|jgi:small conductance mechanosensitive channel